MPQTFDEWLSLYTAFITTGLLVTIIIILRTTVSSKNATIETLGTKIKYLETQTVDAVHQMNEALREEYKELYKKYIENKKQQEEKINELKAEISQLMARIENPLDVAQLSKINTLLSGEFYTPPPIPVSKFNVDDNGIIVPQPLSEEEWNKIVAEADAEAKKLGDS